MLNDTIVALAGGVNQAIAIIRLSGAQAKEITDRVVKRKILNQPSHTIKHNYIIDNDEVIDEVMISFFKAPLSYTTEDMIEINIHGSSYVANKVVSLLIAQGARSAQRGEFTQRAYLNKRIDLSQAEGIKDLIAANNKYNANMAINSVMGSTLKLIEKLRSSLLKTIANIEVNIDYPEYDDVEQLTDEIIKPRVKAWLSDISDIIKKSEQSLLIKEGITTAIIGEPNVGKSSLLNALLEENKALVSSVAGTTRDIVEGEVIINEISLKLLDTAGLRETNDEIEQMGIAKSKQAIKRADLVILVLDGTEKNLDKWQALLDDKMHIVVNNKADLNNTTNGINISALHNDISPLIDKIKELIKIEEIKPQEILQSARQIGLMRQAHQSLTNTLAALEDYQELELIAIDLQSAYQQISDIVGQYHRSDLLDSLFSSFCLGK
ncbi:MAG: tRNA uridine-5-carboxymethylaminomethyl(34) synthesis GTPase MnmE [Erysipelotrichaceae bacterium]